MTMTRRDWWLGISAIVIAVLLHASVPRYEWRQFSDRALVRIDRWFGTAQVGSLVGGTWKSAEDRRAETK